MQLPRPADLPRAIRSLSAYAAQRADVAPSTLVLSFGSLQRFVQALFDDVAEDFGGLNVFEADIEIHCGLDIAMSKYSPHQLVPAGMVFQEYGGSSVPELVAVIRNPVALMTRSVIWRLRVLEVLILHFWPGNSHRSFDRGARSGDNH